MNITGSLKDARRVEDESHRSPYLVGAIYGDSKGRFADGMVVFTSTILEELPDNVFRTRYSTYRVESWRAAA